MADEYTSSTAPDATADAPQSDVQENEDGSVSVKMNPASALLPEEAFNLLPIYEGTEDGKKFCQELVQKVLDDFQEDWDSCEPWRKKRLERGRLWVGDLDPKTGPMEDAANAHLPVMLERGLRIIHRMYGEMFPDKDFVFQAIPSTALTQDRADVITLHDNWQIRKEIPDFFKQNRRALTEFIVHGDCVIHSYRDIAGKRNRHEAMSAEEVVWPYHFKTNLPDMSDIPRKTRVLRKYKHELLELEEVGAFSGVTAMLEKEKEPGFDAGPDLTIRPRVDKQEGKDAPVKSKAAPYTLYEYHGRCKLPGQKKERPIIAIVSPTCRCVVALYLREQEDWKDAARFKSQSEEFGLYQQNQQAFQQIQASELQMQQRLTMPDVPPEEAAQIQQHFAQQHGPLQPPRAPAWLKEGMQGPAPVRMVPIEYFSHGVCIENLDGSLGLGIGLLLEPFNQTVDTVASQYLDSATLANLATILAPFNITMEPGDTRLEPGQIHKVRGVSAEQLQNAFKVIQFPPANQQMLDVVKLMMDAADGVSSAPDVLSGEAGKSNETYRGIATRVEQATKQLTVLAQNYLEFLTEVLKKNARLNAVFMDDEEVKHVVDPRTLESKDVVIGRQMYLEDFDIAFTADTSFGGREKKKSEADQILGMVTSLPPELSQMVFPPSFVREAVVRALKARGLHDMVKFLPPAPPVPQVPMGMQPPPQPGMPGQPPGAPPGPPGPPPGPPQKPPPQPMQ